MKGLQTPLRYIPEQRPISFFAFCSEEFALGGSAVILLICGLFIAPQKSQLESDSKF
jgi:hypothetical protein